MSQNLHGSGTVATDGVFEQAPQMDVKYSHICSSFLHVRSWSRKPMHGQYCCLTMPVDMKKTLGWLKAMPDQALQTWYYEHHILHQDVSPTCHMQCRPGDS